MGVDGMNIPNWKDAPEWANWLAMDKSGAWAWFEYEPEDREFLWIGRNGRSRTAAFKGWDKTKQERPK